LLNAHSSDLDSVSTSVHLLSSSAFLGDDREQIQSLCIQQADLESFSDQPTSYHELSVSVLCSCETSNQRISIAMQVESRVAEKHAMPVVEKLTFAAFGIPRSDLHL
jgi:hypothetical protein